MSLHLSKSVTLKAAFVAGLSGIMLVGIVVISTRRSRIEPQPAATLHASTLPAAPATMPNAASIPAFETAKIQGMNDSERSAYIQQLLDNLGDNRLVVDDALRLGDLGPQASRAVEPLIRYAPSTNSVWPIQIALARIGEPSDIISQYLSMQIANGESPLACASLALLGNKAKCVAAEIESVYARSARNYEERRSTVHSDDMGFGDGDHLDLETLISFDSAIALVACDTNGRNAVSAMSRIMEGDPRVDWHTGGTAYAQILFDGVKATDKPDFWYGLALAKALEAANDSPALCRQLERSLVEGTTTGDTRFVAPSLPESIANEVGARRVSHSEPSGRTAKVSSNESYPAPYEPPPFDPMNPRGANTGIRVGRELSAQTAQRMIQIRHLRAYEMRCFCCWAFRNLPDRKWSAEERDIDVTLQRLELLGDGHDKQQTDQSRDIMMDPWRMLHTADSGPSADFTAECLGLLKHPGDDAINFLTQLLSQKNRPIERGRAALALGRIGSAAKSAAPLLKELADQDVSPSVRKAACWALTQVTR